MKIKNLQDKTKYLATVFATTFLFLLMMMPAYAAVDNQPNPDRPGGPRSGGGGSVSGGRTCGGGAAHNDDHACGLTYAARGSFDGVYTDANNCLVNGWAYDPDNANTNIGVHIYKDGPSGSGTFIGACIANTSRPDVNQAFHISGNHGFNCQLPASYRGTGNHALYIHAIDINGTPHNLLWTNGKQLNCLPPPPPPATPTLTFNAAPASVTTGGTVNLTWSSQNATNCTASGAWSGPQNTNGTQSSGTLNSPGLQTFILTCTGPGGSISKTASVTIINPTVTAPTLTFYASPTNVTIGGSANLNWTATNATNCTASGSWSGSKNAVDGTESTGALTTVGQHTYTLTCTGTGGNVTRIATIDVAAPPVPPQCNDTIDNDGNGVVDFPNDPGCTTATDTSEAAPPSITANGKGNEIFVRNGSHVAIAWQTNGDTNCRLSQNVTDNDSNPNNNGNNTVVVHGQNIFTLTCDHQSDSVRVHVLPVMYES